VAELTREALDEAIRKKVARPLFATLVGDHLRGWASEKSPYVVSGAMLLPVREMLGLRPARETKERTIGVEGRDVAICFHDLRKYLDDIARVANTRALEELFSPYVVFGGPEFEQLRRIARAFLTKSCYHDYVERSSVPRAALASDHATKVADLLEASRLSLAGTHMLRTGELESSLVSLSERYEAFWLRPFVNRQQRHGEGALITPEESRILRYDVESLEEQLHAAHAASTLPDGSGSITTLDEFLIDLRLRDVRDAGIG
jgi:predicted nucleotidyltransferase